VHLIRLINADFRAVLRVCRPVNAILADPPDNIGLSYNGFKDKYADQEYREMLRAVIYEGSQVCDIIWLSFNARHTLTVGSLIHDFMCMHGGWELKPCVQTYTFYQHNHKDLGNAYRPLYRLKRTNAPIYPEAVRVPSWRQLNGDKRADPRGRVPGDVFDFPRVTGNSKQRRAYSPTQLHEGLYERCIKISCAPGDSVLDLFAGSGTLGRVAVRCGVSGTMVEISTETCEEIAKDQGLCRIDAATWAGEGSVCLTGT
jgi:site-specific DNA-methyltransferase (adenine-specific)